MTLALAASIALLVPSLLLSLPSIAQGREAGCNHVLSTELPEADGSETHVLSVSISGEACGTSTVALEVRNKAGLLLREQMTIAVALGDVPEGQWVPMSRQFISGIAPFRIGGYVSPRYEQDSIVVTGHVDPERRERIRSFNGWAFTMPWKSGSFTFAYDPQARRYVLFESTDAS
jgi:hypothetical protein